MRPEIPVEATCHERPVRVSVSEGYRLWSRSYDLDPNPLIALELRTLFKLLGDVEGRVLMDVACGTGRWMTEAAARGAKVFGVDLSREMLLVARVKPDLGNRLVCADACSLPFSDQCADLVICSFALGYIRSRDQVMRELGRLVKRGGTVLASDLHPRALLKGWQRSFRCGSNLFEVENYPHTAEQLVGAGRSAGLDLREVLEPHFGDPEKLLMRRAGREHLIEQVTSVPAVLALVWKRP